MSDIQSQEKNVPKILLEFLVYGLEKNKSTVSKALDELQKQQEKSRVAKKRMRILWYMDNGEKTDDEKKEWLLFNTKSKYYKFIEKPYDIPKNFVKDCMQKIRVLEKSIDSIKNSEIYVTPKIKIKAEN